MAEPVLLWCTPCQALRPYRDLKSVGKMCAVCGSGRVRPPLRDELPVQPATKPPE